MKSILSIQSHVSYGYVGNRAAVFPLQRLGFDVTAINTVEFSNHTGYGDWEGEVFSAEHIRGLIDGIRRRGIFPEFHALLTGYMGNPALGELILELVHELKRNNPHFIYCCDPVMGDTEGGCFVHPDISSIFKHDLLPAADILTPNPFELQFLTEKPVNTLSELTSACDILLARGPSTVLVTSVVCKDTPADTIQMLLHRKEGSWIVNTPRLHSNQTISGAGDLTAALFLAHTLEGLPPKEILEKTAASVFGVYEATVKAGSRELQIIAAQEELMTPSNVFRVM